MADCRNQAMSGRGCSREALQSMPLAMAYVPWQFWGQTYELEKALQCGTVPASSMGVPGCPASSRRCVEMPEILRCR